METPPGISQELADRPVEGAAAGWRTWYDLPAALYGFLITGCAVALCIVAAAALTLSGFAPQSGAARSAQAILSVAVIGIGCGLTLFFFDLFVLVPKKRGRWDVIDMPPESLALTVVLTAYDDAPSIGQVVDDFKRHPLVKRVIVVDNNSRDGTAGIAESRGAKVVREKRQGYGHCVHRALTEGCAMTDTGLTLLCEGDATFRARDIDKFVAFIAHASIVNGTRIVEQLRARRTQLTTFMYYGNFFVGKLLELKHLGKGTFTDVGTTYKLCRNEALGRLLPHLNPEVNLEFNAHFLDTALRQNLFLVECPITFHDRVGVSKGGNVSNRRAFSVGMRMISGLLFGWRKPGAEAPAQRSR